MAPLSTSPILIGSTSLTNISSARHRPPSLAAPRVEGWTETWGNIDKEVCIDEDNANLPLPSRHVTLLKEEYDYIGDRPSLDKDSPNLMKLTQYRVAWFEQLVLRMNFIPHTMENSSYAATESTGGLPCLLDFNNQRDDNSEDVLQHSKPVLIGRNQPGGLGSSFFDKDDKSKTKILHSSGSHIVDYLRLKHSSMNNNIIFSENMQDDGKVAGDALAYEALIQEKLNYILSALRYGSDPSWVSVGKPQIIQATLDPTNNGKSQKKTKPFPLFAWYQAYSERALALHNLLPSSHAMSPSLKGGLATELFRYNDYRHSTSSDSTTNADKESSDNKEEKEVHHQHHPFSSFFPSYGGGGGGGGGRVNVSRALEIADLHYTALENKLASSVGYDTLLGTEKPTYVDALLFAHLAEALCDVHLILVLAKHTRLIKYFHWMYQCYFGEGYTELWSSHSSKDQSTDWIERNNLVNSVNAFNQVPEANAKKQSSKAPSGNTDEFDMVHAVEIMKELAIHSSELDETIRDAVKLRTMDGKEKLVLESYNRPIGSRLYRWVMGNDIEFWRQSGDKRSEDTTTDFQSDETGEDNVQNKKQKELLKRMKRDRRANDELWISGVVISVIAALVISGGSKKR